MSALVGDFRARIRRRAIVMEIGGFRPPNDPKSSWFGKVNWCSGGETWPISKGSHLHPLAQINLSELPFRPPRLHDSAYLTVFIDPHQLPNQEPNGTHWCVRAYRELGDLVPLQPPQLNSKILPFPMRSIAIESDYPIHDDIAGEIPDEIGSGYYDLFPNAQGFKFGGWPSLIQSEIFWAPWNRHPFSPEYVLQIDSTEKCRWSWGDGGVGYFGRGTAKGHVDEWALEWQCY